MILTPKQKMEALAYRFYQGGTWVPKAGDFYTTSRADLEVYQVVSVDGGKVRTRYTDGGTDAIAEWDGVGFLTEGFGPKRVYVPEWCLRPEAPAPVAPEPVAVRYGFDLDGWLYADSGNGSDWFKRAMDYPDAEPLYAAPPTPARTATDGPASACVYRAPGLGTAATFEKG